MIKAGINKKILFSLLTLLILVILILLSYKSVKIDATIYSLLPSDESLKRAVHLTTQTSISEKVLVYIEKGENFDELHKEIMKSISSYDFLINATPQMKDINEIRSYLQDNALVLYPYETMGSPFSEQKLKLGVEAKYKYLLNSPFEDLSESFFSDPINLGLSILLLQYSADSMISTYMNGLLSEDGKSFLMVFESGISPDEREGSLLINKLNDEIIEIGNAFNSESFVFSTHLYFNETSGTIQKEVSIISILSILLTIFAFLFFFRNISILLYSFIPIFIGITFTFFIVSQLYSTFGAIALAFGFTSAGICIDYSIHYISKVKTYSTLKELRQSIGKPMIMGWLTTIISFALLPFSGIKSLEQIGIFGTLVVTISFIASWFILPIYIRPETYTKKFKNIEFIKLLGSKRKLFVYSLSVIFAFFLLLTFFAKIESNPFALDMVHKNLDEKSNLINSKFSESTDNVFLAIKGSNEKELAENSIVFTKLISENNIPIRFFNPYLYFASDEIVQSRCDFFIDNFDLEVFNKVIDNSEFTADAFTPFLQKIERIKSGNYQISDVPNFISKQYENSFILYNEEFYQMIHIGDRAVSEQILSLCNQNNIDVISIDILKESSKGLIRFEKRALFLVLISVLTILLVLIFFYKNIFSGIIATLPTIVGLISAVGVSTLFGIKLNIMHITALLLITGIGVDYGIFATSIWLRNSSEIEKDRTIQSILSSSITTVAGFGVLSLSTSRAMSSLGISILAGITSAFLCAYIILPYILEYKQKKIDVMGK